MSSRKNSKANALNYRAFFRHRWQAFIRANFESPAHVAHVFGTDPATAANWWMGSNAPSGFAVGYAYQHFPTEAAETLREAS